MNNIEDLAIRVFNPDFSPMPLLDGRLVTYFVSKDNLCWHSFPMCNVKNIKYVDYSWWCGSNKLLITEEYDNRETNTTVIFDNNTIAKNQFDRLTLLQQKFYGKSYNCNDVPMPEF